MAKSQKRKSFPLRMSQDVYDELRRWADEDMRSVNAQIEYLLREAINHRKGKRPGSAKNDGKSGKRSSRQRKSKS
ncbi:MAG: ribbon-helix-helix domain-containing protein [Pirellulaceae bacterium]